jgi:hypothetical protein
LRKELSKQGLDAGAETIAAHLARQTPIGGGQAAAPAVSTIWRILLSAYYLICRSPYDLTCRSAS